MVPPKAGWLEMAHPIHMDDFLVPPPFQETSKQLSWHPYHLWTLPFLCWMAISSPFQPIRRLLPEKPEIKTISFPQFHREFLQISKKKISDLIKRKKKTILSTSKISPIFDFPPCFYHPMDPDRASPTTSLVKGHRELRAKAKASSRRSSSTWWIEAIMTFLLKWFSVY